MALDFSLLGQGPQFGNVLQAYDAGRLQKKETDIKNALALYATDPDAGMSAIRKADAELGIKMEPRYEAHKTQAKQQEIGTQYTADPKAARTSAIGTGNKELVDFVNSLDEGAYKQATHLAEVTGHHAFQASQLPLAERGAWMQQHPDLFTPEQIANPTDQILSGLAQEALTTEQMIQEKARQAEALSRQDDRTTDNDRAAAEAEERRRHNEEMENIARGNMGANVTRAIRAPAGRAPAASGVPSGYKIIQPGNR